MSTKATLLVRCPVPRLAYFGLSWVRAKALASLGLQVGRGLGAAWALPGHVLVPGKVPRVRRLPSLSVASGRPLGCPLGIP